MEPLHLHFGQALDPPGAIGQRSAARDVEARARPEEKMAKKRKKQKQVPRLLTWLRTFGKDETEVRVVVETPKGSSYKFKYNTDDGAFELSAALPEGLAFPFDFGFIPSTVGEDGDPLDVLLLLDHPVAAGCVTSARLAGVIEIRQRKLGAKADARWIRNDRFIAVASHGHNYRHVRTLENLAPEVLDEIEAFLIQSARVNGKQLDILGRGDPKTARKLVRVAVATRH
jgi:inorganic pyrophosphatase